MHTKSSIAANAVALLAVSLGFIGAAAGADGVIQINQTRALAGGVSAGDTPGFPVTIDESGSYRLTGNLTVADPDTLAIQIDSAARHVSLDLNGFALIGPTTCTGFPASSCSPAGVGSGVYADVSVGSLSISNGSVRGFARNGIEVEGIAVVRLERLQAIDNGDRGFNVDIEGSAHLENLQALRNLNAGIRASSDGSCIASKNSAWGNGEEGIFLRGSCVSVANAASANGATGIYVDANAGVVTENVAYGNQTGGIDLEGTGVISRSATADNVTGAGIRLGGVGVLTHNSSSSNQVGLHADDSSVVIGNAAVGSDSVGIRAAGSSTIAFNLVSGSGDNGLDISASSNIVDNTIFGSDAYGIETGASTGYGRNVLNGNNIDVSSGAQMSVNLCDGVPCP